MAVDDFRIHTSWRTHHKRLKLRRLLGSDGIVAIENLWGFCAMTEGRRDGNLYGMDAMDIAIQAEWERDPAELLGALVTVCRLLDETPKGYVVHDYTDWQPWVSGGDRRSWLGKLNANKGKHMKGAHNNAPHPECPECYPELLEGGPSVGAPGSPVGTQADPVGTQRVTHGYPSAPTPTPTPVPTPIPSAASFSGDAIFRKDLEAIVASEWRWPGTVTGVPSKWAAVVAHYEPFTRAEVDEAREAVEKQGGKPSWGLLVRVLERLRTQASAKPIPGSEHAKATTRGEKTGRERSKARAPPEPPKYRQFESEPMPERNPEDAAKLREIREKVLGGA